MKTTVERAKVLHQNGAVDFIERTGTIVDGVTLWSDWRVVAREDDEGACICGEGFGLNLSCPAHAPDADDRPRTSSEWHGYAVKNVRTGRIESRHADLREATAWAKRHELQTGAVYLVIREVV